MSGSTNKHAFQRRAASPNSIRGRKLVHGVGINDVDYCVTSGVGAMRKQCPYHARWVSMLSRCYSPRHLERHPTYAGCSVAEAWLTFSNFREWMASKNWAGNHLDKDLLKTGNRIYSPETCMFVSPQVNTLFLKGNGNRRSGVLLPEGVSTTSQRGFYRAYVREGGLYMHLGHFKSVDAAEKASLTAKTEVIFRAIKALESSDDPRLAGALHEMADKILTKFNNL